MVIYLRHPLHGEKVASTDVEAKQDRENGWVDFDPAAPKVPNGVSDHIHTLADVNGPTTPPVVPDFLAPAPVVESDLPEDFPGRKELIVAGYATWASVTDLDRAGLIALKGIGEKTADAILEVMDS